MDRLNSEDFKCIECAGRRGEVRRLLLSHREERRPYVFFTSAMEHRELRTLLVPVSRLEEERYKAEICTYLSRVASVRCLLLQANDYGSGARTNAAKIVSRFERVSQQTGTDLQYEVHPAKKNSDGVIREAVMRVREFNADMLLLTASREYGLDDILFGPPELHAVLHSPVPVMLVNPRGDLFSLCD